MRLSVWWRWHQCRDKFLVISLCFISIMSLFVDLILHKSKELAFRDIFKVPSITHCLTHKPLEHFLKSILPALLVSYIVAVG